MEVVTSIAELHSRLSAARRASMIVGLVPTMGYLHDGHLSLMRCSVRDCGYTVGTIFVNPLQFAADEDLSTYPRDPDGDAAKAAATGIDLLFTPPLIEMYPEPVRTIVSVDVAIGSMESAARPTHFDGVATVVAKLFALVGACRAYFGEKDYQQLAVIRRMAFDLSFPVEVVACPIVREPDGLAMSSRNVYLSDEQRAQAAALHRAVEAGASALAGGERQAAIIRDHMRAVVGRAPLAELDYAEVVDAQTFELLDVAEGDVRLLVAARFGATRLLDNVGVRVS